MAADNPTGGPGIVTESTPLLRDQPTPFSRTPKDGRSVTASTYDGDLLPYNSYSTIDWLQGLIKDSARRSQVESPPRHSIRMRVATWWDLTQGWVAAFAVGILTAGVAFAVDVSVETVADWKEGYCARSIWLNRRACCSVAEFDGSCSQWTPWAQGFSSRYAIYVGFALLFGLISVSLTMTTKASMPAANSNNSIGQGQPQKGDKVATGKILYLASGSGIPEIKTILSGFEIPHLLDLKVLVVKAVGAVFAVATGMCLGKEGPFVHISTCVGYLVGSLVPKYAANERKMREMLAVACSAGLSVAFGAPIGGVLFSYEEISTYFPRRVLWRSYLCSLVAAAALKELDPAGTG
ncbi:unnamed protein product [Aspergillus oryzae]|nr:unnamed protein product [Aspergillus oryzae]GMF88725.1 unnamed protein product [Aspergillus oryzae]